MIANNEQCSLTEWTIPNRIGNSAEWRCPQGSLEAYREEIIRQLGKNASAASFLSFSGGYPYVHVAEYFGEFGNFQIPGTNTNIMAASRQGLGRDSFGYIAQVTRHDDNNSGQMFISPEDKHLEIRSSGSTSRASDGNVRARITVEESKGVIDAQLEIHSVEPGFTTADLICHFTGNGLPSYLHIDSRGNNKFLREGLGVDMLADGAYQEFRGTDNLSLDVEDFVRRQAILSALAGQLGHSRAAPQLNLPATAARAYQTIGFDPFDALVFYDRV